MKLLFFLERALPLLFWILISFAFDLPYVAILTAIAAMTHELGHIFVILRLKKSSAHLRGTVSGPRITMKTLGYRDELTVAAGGPLANLLIAALSCIILPFGTTPSYVLEFITVNLLTAISNLLPVRGFDGYRILYCLASKSRRALFFQDLLYCLSFLLSILITLLALYLILKLGEGYWAFILFFSIILAEIKKRDKNTF